MSEKAAICLENVDIANGTSGTTVSKIVLKLNDGLNLVRDKLKSTRLGMFTFF